MADIVWRTTRLPDAVIGAAYEASLAFTGNATAVTAASATPPLPTGLSFSADFVRIVGTPLKAALGVWTGTVTLTDTAGAQASGTLSLNVRWADDADRVSLDFTGGHVASDIVREWPK